MSIINAWNQLTTDIQFCSCKTEYLQAIKMWVFSLKDFTVITSKQGNVQALIGKSCELAIREQEDVLSNLPFLVSHKIEIFTPFIVVEEEVKKLVPEEAFWNMSGEDYPWNVTVNLNMRMCHEIILQCFGEQGLLRYYQRKGQLDKNGTPTEAVQKLKATTNPASIWRLICQILPGHDDLQIHLLVQISSENIGNGVFKQIYLSQEAKAIGVQPKLAYHYTLKFEDVINFNIVNSSSEAYIAKIGMPRSLVNYTKPITEEIVLYNSPDEVPLNNKNAENKIRVLFKEYVKEQDYQTKEEYQTAKITFLSTIKEGTKLYKWLKANSEEKALKFLENINPRTETLRNYSVGLNKAKAAINSKIEIFEEDEEEFTII
ncbi:hypothetical protein H6G81_09030 [Scytonema hofmannii FACHB-248]|uniref:Uncharacterized protein n=1 Tax=Scytonema hofmannii FACHB-248 TaxID=1842502 RepID=A0ABR8GMM4_9CYAN|nr:MULTISPECIES: hypothetical protein [Nostocales]MBD2604667.1 hypothetical protein [Scytonema hofmannii FACHB-248]